VGFFKDIANAFGSATGTPDQQLLQSGLLGRGEISGFTASGMTIQVNNSLVERKCTMTVTVYLDGTAPYQATVEQRIPEVYIPQLASGQAIVAVRVDPADHARIALDLTSPVPEITMPGSDPTSHSSAAWVLANGKPITVVLVGFSQVGVKSAAGDEVYALTLTVATGVPTPYQIQVGNGVPATALPLLYPGSKLHAKLGDGPNDVAVDWAAGAVAA
jgi:hypothetical protein